MGALHLACFLLALCLSYAVADDQEQDVCPNESTTTTTSVTHPDGTEISVTTTTEPDACSPSRAHGHALAFTRLWVRTHTWSHPLRARANGQHS